ncbi:MAG: M28 family peptidase [Candidatus Bathyarchaeia archaeon]
MNRCHRLPIVALLLFLSAVPILSRASSYASGMSRGGQAELQYREVIESINTSTIIDHLKFLTGSDERIWSRVTGYEGFYLSEQYILSYLRQVGVADVRTEGFEVTVPVDHGASVEILSSDGDSVRTIESFPLWPNLVNPCPYQTIGTDRLIYGGSGDLEDFNGKDVEDAIVLMDFNTRWYWKNAALLGAKAVLYIEPSDTTRVESLFKTMSIPLNFPRLLVSKEEGEYLLGLLVDKESIPIRLKSTMKWESVQANNIVGYVYGTEFRDNVIAIAAHYDSYSVVPSISPGATDALGVAALLELARFFSENPPRRTVMFVALAGHWQGISGSREFVDAHFSEMGSKVKLFFDMDFSTDSDELSIYHQGSSYPYLLQPLAPRYNWIRAQIIDVIFPSIQVSSEKVYTLLDGITRPVPIFEHAIMMFDSDAFTTACYGGGVVFHTTNALRRYYQTSLDTFSRLRLENFFTQLEVVFGILYGVTQLPSIRVEASFPAVRLGNDWGFTVLDATVGQYNMTTAWYDPFFHEDCLVYVRFYTIPLVSAGEAMQPGQAASPSMSGVADIPGLTFQIASLGGIARMAGQSGVLGPIEIVLKPDESGRVKIKGIKPYTTGFISAYVVDQGTGSVLYATDMGFYAFGGISVPDPSSPSPKEYFVYQERIHKWLAVFECGSIALLNILNPISLGYTGIAVELFNYLSHGPPIWWSQDSFLPDVMVYTQPGVPTEIVLRGPQRSILAGFNYPMGLLFNASAEYPEGQGYVVGSGATLILENTPLRLLGDYYWLYSKRLNALREFRVSNPRAESYDSLCSLYMQYIEEALAGKRYDSAYSNAMTAWSYAVGAYGASMNMIMEVVNTTVFFFILLVPFAFLTERILSPTAGPKRIGIIIMIISICLGVFLNFHPGFHISTNVPVIIIGSLVAILGSVLAGLIVSEARAVSREVQRAAVGAHFIEVSRGGILSTAFSTGIQNMRKRKFRTVLTLTSITVIVLGMITFTSLSNITVLHHAGTPGNPPYNGMLIRKRPWAPIPEQLSVSLNDKFKDEASVAVRTWVYPPMQNLPLGPGVVTYALLGVTPDEAQVTNLDKILLKGAWFESGDFAHCLVPQAVADRLGIDVGSIIDVYGLELRVKGIFDNLDLWDGRSGIMDLDREAITPMNFVAVGGETGAATILVDVPHINGDYTIIIPYNLALEAFNALPYSIAISFKDTAGIDEKARLLSLALGTDVYVGNMEEKSISIFRPTFGVSLSGTEMLYVPLLISAFTLLNVMLSAVYERIKEIGIFASLGLAPAHVSGMFLSESLLYGIMSAVVGYLLGVVSINLAYAANLMPPTFYPNYSSTAIVLVVILSISAVLTSTLYPALKSSRLVTPSFARRWRRPSRPTGDDWTLPLPFVCREEELRGVLAYFKDFLDIHGSVGAGTFATEEAGYVKMDDATASLGWVPALRARIWLAPFEMGLRQTIILRPVPEMEDRNTFALLMHRDAGFRDTWINANEYFMDDIRKQFLLWRASSPADKQRYIEEGFREIRFPDAGGVN